MPPEHGRRLHALIPNCKLVEIDDCGTLVSLDQPARLADELRTFLLAA
jgi:pimeloyl-ACP methyl ester carboxylesterase